MLARVSSYDALGSVMAMPAGALIAGPLAAAIGVSATQYAAAGAIVLASALALIPREIRTMRAGHEDLVQPAHLVRTYLSSCSRNGSTVAGGVMPAGAAA